MRRSGLICCHFPSSVQKILRTSGTISQQGPLSSRQCFTAIIRPSVTSSEKSRQTAYLDVRYATTVVVVPRNVLCCRFCSTSKSSKSKEQVKLGQASSQNLATLGSHTPIKLPLDSARTFLEDIDPAEVSKQTDVSTQPVRQDHWHDDAWEFYQRLNSDEYLEILSRSDTYTLRDEILGSALTANSRLASVVDAANRLLDKNNFLWPDLYIKVIHHMLKYGRHGATIKWHYCLAPRFLPSVDIFGAMLSSFIVDPSPHNQSILMALYVSSTPKQLYDYIIPVLFAAGQSKLARLWRKKLLIFRDVPNSAKSRPFLQFLVQYYPSIPLTKEEKTIAGSTNNIVEEWSSQRKGLDDSSKGQFSDSIVARWFASTWTSIDFALNFAQRLGLRVIGPRSLQSLALRESGAKMVTLRLARLERLGIGISSQNYCKVLIFFAQHGEESLLADLLTCDIHPDEFDDVETRQMLMAESVRNGDWRKERLFQGIEWAIKSDPSSRHLNALLSSYLASHTLSKARRVLDRMEALKVNIYQSSASQLLETSFRGLGKHPKKRYRQPDQTRVKSQPLLNGAIDMIRRVALHDVAIPLRYWELLLYNLGRCGRLDELQQLSEEIIQLYSPPLGGLIPICSEDLPHFLLKRQDTIGSSICTSGGSAFVKDGQQELPQKIETASCNDCFGDFDNSKDPKVDCLRDKTNKSRSDVEAFDQQEPLIQNLPTDLPFSHRYHPVQQIFNARLQRSIIRWGFDQRLRMFPSCSPPTHSEGYGITAYDVACGVRLLARLRDLGVLIDIQVVRTAIVSRIALGQVPGRRKARCRDKHESSTEHLKLLFDEAWGSEIFPSLSELKRQLDTQKPKLWERYPKLFGQAFS